MKYGKFLRNEAVAQWSHLYLNYKGLKQQLKKVVAEQVPSSTFVRSNIVAPSEFDALVALLESEIRRISDTLQGIYQDLRQRFVVMQRLAGNSDMIELRVEAERTESLVESFETFHRHNVEAIRKILKKIDKRTQHNVSAWVAQTIRGTPLANMPIDALIVALGDVWTLLRNEEAEPDSPKKWVPPDTFERTTTKYLVDRAHLMRVKLHIIKHLPALVINRKQPVSSLTSDFLEVAGTAWTSSVYVDNENRDIYHTRMARREGAQLFRIRWYGSVTKRPESVFVERKTHHESWVNAKSVKERFEMPEHKVKDFLNGAWAPAPLPNAVKSEELATETQQAIMKQSYRPVLRTIYSRMAFQQATRNDIRLSLDTDLSFVKESGAINGTWCKDVSEHGFQCDDVHQFQWAVLEIKLQANAPSWVEELTSAGLVREVEKFSKFCHGSALLEGQSGKLKVLPYWFNFKEMVDRGSPQPFGESSPDTAVKVPAVFPQGHALSTAVDTIRGKGDASQCAQTVPSWTTPNKSEYSTAISSRKGQAVALPLKRVKVEPKTIFANERTFIQYVSPAVFLLSIAVGMQTMGVDPETPRPLIVHVGISFSVVAIFFMMYALYVYFKRVRKIRRCDPGGYEELFGPMFIVVMLSFLAFLPVLVNSMTDSTEANPLAPRQQQVAVGPPVASCGTQLALPGAAAPAGIYVDRTSGKLLVPSPYKLFAIDPERSQSPFFYSLPGMEFGAVTAVPSDPEVVYLLGEKDQAEKAEIVVYNTVLMVVQRRIKLSNVFRKSAKMPWKGLAACPSAMCPERPETLHFWVAHGQKLHLLKESADGDGVGSVVGVDVLDVASILCRQQGADSPNVPSVLQFTTPTACLEAFDKKSAISDLFIGANHLGQPSFYVVLEHFRTLVSIDVPGDAGETAWRAWLLPDGPGSAFWQGFSFEPAWGVGPRKSYLVSGRVPGLWSLDFDPEHGFLCG